MSVRFALSFPAAGALFVLSVAVAGCGAGNGGVCQLDRDCASGLICCGETSSLRGVCRRPEESCAVATVDAGPPIDAPIDAAPVPDVPVDSPVIPEDAPMSVDAPGDAGTDAPPGDAGTDAGEPDAPTPIDDAGADAP